MIGAVVPAHGADGDEDRLAERARSRTCALSAQNCSGHVMLITDQRRGRACHSAPYRISSTSVATWNSARVVTV